MAFDLNRLVRRHIPSLKPYASAREEYSGKEGVFLDGNENALGSTASKPFNRYPDPLQQDLKQSIADIKGIDPAGIFLGNGSDEVIELLIKAFCEPAEDHMFILPPTYGMYKVCADIQGVEVKEVLLTEDFQPDVQGILEQSDSHSKLLFLCSPNNPTANAFSDAAIKELLEKFPGIVVLDEAYIDFATHQSYIRELDQYPNLVVMQTFSKAWGLAALRLGMGFASEELISVLNKIKFPYNVNGITQEWALEALRNQSAKDTMVKQILEEKEKLKTELEKLSVVKTIYPSDANFFLVEVTDAKKVYEELIEDQIIVRNRSNVPRCKECLRITVGTPEENKKLIERLKAIET